MLIHILNTGDKITQQASAIIINFSGERNVLSTSPHNGGYRKNLKWVFNQGGETDGKLKAPTYAKHIALTAQDLGIDPAFACGLTTAAFVENVSIKSQTYKDTTVTAVVTGGIEVNGGRAGDPATWHESDGHAVFTGGTINIMLYINVNLSQGAMARSIITATEAKTAAIQELMASSRYSDGLATGSGTDGIIVVSNAQSPVKLTEAGKHFKLGELIGQTVIAAVKEALYLQTGLCEQKQFDILRRMNRFGITDNIIPAKSKIKNDFIVYTTLYAHLIDQLNWNLITKENALPITEKLLELMEINPKYLDKKTDLKTAMILAYKKGLEDI